MTTPGVGPVVALTYRATVDVPPIREADIFKPPRDVRPDLLQPFLHRARFIEGSLTRLSQCQHLATEMTSLGKLSGFHQARINPHSVTRQ
jgi:hypothetical protein